MCKTGITLEDICRLYFCKMQRIWYTEYEVSCCLWCCLDKLFALFKAVVRYVQITEKSTALKVLLILTFLSVFLIYWILLILFCWIFQSTILTENYATKPNFPLITLKYYTTLLTFIMRHVFNHSKILYNSFNIYYEACI